MEDEEEGEQRRNLEVTGLGSNRLGMVPMEGRVAGGRVGLGKKEVRLCVQCQEVQVEISSGWLDIGAGGQGRGQLEIQPLKSLAYCSLQKPRERMRLQRVGEVRRDGPEDINIYEGQGWIRSGDEEDSKKVGRESRGRRSSQTKRRRDIYFFK